MKRNLTRAAGVSALIALGLAVTAAPSPAAVDMFLKMTGIPGSSRDENHKDEIEVQSVQYGLSNTGTTSFGGGGGGGKVQFQDLSFTKRIDKSSPLLLKRCLDGTHIPEAILTTRRAGAGVKGSGDFYKVTLKDCVVSAYQIGGGSDVPMESLSLNFARVEWEYLAQQPDGTLKAAGKGSWDVKSGKGAATSSAGSGAGAGSDTTRPSRLPILMGPTGLFGGGVRQRGLSGLGIFAKVPGIDGESRDSKHANEIEIQSFSWGASNQGTFGTGGGGGAGKVSMQDFHFTKMLDKASVPLMVACAAGSRIAQPVVISVNKAGRDQQEFIRITFSDVMVTTYSQASSAGAEIPVDAVALNFSKIEWEFKEQNAQGQMVPAGKVGYDLKLNKAL